MIRIKKEGKFIDNMIYFCKFEFSNEKIIKQKKHIKTLGEYTTAYTLKNEKKIIDSLVLRMKLKDVTHVKITKLKEMSKVNDC